LVFEDSTPPPPAVFAPAPCAPCAAGLHEGFRAVGRQHDNELHVQRHVPATRASEVLGVGELEDDADAPTDVLGVGEALDVEDVPTVELGDGDGD
jgi:hypothetical protein